MTSNSKRAAVTLDKPIRFDGDDAPTVAMACTACGATGSKRRHLVCRNQVGAVGTDERMRDVFRCEACRSLFFHPYPAIDYTSHTDKLSVRDYLEMGASIDIVTGNVLRAVPDDRRTGRMLDIGCGFGFALDVVRTLRGWTVKGFEPSQYGALGRDQLGLDIVNDFAPANADPQMLYDIVHCSEVIEHIHDAPSFVDLLDSYLAPDGVLVLTTPDAERITQHTDVSLALALLSPGAHTILFSAQAMSDLFRRAGLVHVAVDKRQVSTLYYASRVPLRLKDAVDLDEPMLAYLKSAIARAAPGSPLDTGMRQRFFRKATELGRFAEAQAMFVDVLADDDPDFEGVDDTQSFAAKWPFCIASGTYYEGMRLLLHAADYVGAARTLGAAHRLCARKIQLMPQIAVVESDLMWRATYHQALALKFAGDGAAALAVLDTLTAPTREGRLSEDLVPMIGALRREVEDAAKAVLVGDQMPRPVKPAERRGWLGRLLGLDGGRDRD